MSDKDIVNEDTNTEKTRHVFAPHVIFGSIIFWSAVGYWLYLQESSVREDWLARLALFALISPLIALLIPQLATVFFVTGGLSFCIMGIGYSGDIGKYGHYVYGAMLFVCGVVCVVSSIAAAKLHPSLMRLCRRIWRT